MINCWNHESEKRPDFSVILKVLKSISDDLKNAKAK